MYKFQKQISTCAAAWVRSHRMGLQIRAIQIWAGAPIGRQEAGAINWPGLRVAHIIPETGIELTPERFILEMDFERLNGVDFKKGCYVGQEIVARMKHKTELRKGLRQVKITGSAPIGTAILANEKPAGILYTQHGGLALAYLRFDRIAPEMVAGSAVITV